MAARLQSKVASRAAGYNYEPAEDPVRTQTLLEWVSSNLQPFETISLRSAARGHDTEEWKYKSPLPRKNTKLSQLQHFVARSTLVIYCERRMEHLGRNRGGKICRWTSWRRGWGGGADRPAGKVMTSIHKVTAILDFVNSAELSRHFHLWFIVFWCGLVSSTPPSIFPVITAFSSWGTSASDSAPK